MIRVWLTWLKLAFIQENSLMMMGFLQDLKDITFWFCYFSSFYLMADYVLASSVLTQRYLLNLPVSVSNASTGAKQGAANYANLGNYNLLVGPVTDYNLQEFTGLLSAQHLYNFCCNFILVDFSSAHTSSYNIMNAADWAYSLSTHGKHYILHSVSRSHIWRKILEAHMPKSVSKITFHLWRVRSSQ